MLRRELVVPPGLWSQADLAAHLGVPSGLRVEMLAERSDESDDGKGGYARLLPGVMLDGGERVVVYAFDPARDDELAAINAEFAGYYVEGRDTPWPDELAAIALTVPARGADVLEICCGAGRVAPHLLREGNRVTAIDLSEPCIAGAPARATGVDFRVADATRLPFAERSFDVVLCLENSLGVFFSRRAQVVAEMIRVARGRVVLGLREVPGLADDELLLYAARSGHLEIAQAHSRAAAERILAALPPDAAARLGERRWLDGGPRPWGGRERYLIVELT
jgi:SAM-dependent methyltransferase